MATQCNTLQHTTRCNTLQHTATHCNTLQHTATHGNTLHHSETHAWLTCRAHLRACALQAKEHENKAGCALGMLHCAWGMFYYNAATHTALIHKMHLDPLLCEFLRNYELRLFGCSTLGVLRCLFVCDHVAALSCACVCAECVESGIYVRHDSFTCATRLM